MNTDISTMMKYVDSVIGSQKAENDLSLQFSEFSMTIDPASFVYNNCYQKDTDGHSVKTDLASVIWRIHGTDNPETLPENSFLRLYIPTVGEVADLYKEINPNFNNESSEDYAKYKDYLGLDTLAGRLSPLYNITRAAPMLGKPNVFRSSIPLAHDRQEMILNQVMNDETAPKDDEEKLKEFIYKMSNQYASMNFDQLNYLFFYIVNGYLSDQTGSVLCAYPSLDPLAVSRDKKTIVQNLFASNYPVYQPLRSMKFFLKNKVINLKMDMDFFDLGNMFDALYGIVLLSLAAHYGKYERGLVHIATPYYRLPVEHFSFFQDKKNNYDNLEKNSLSLIIPNPTNDFSDLKVNDIEIEH